MMPKLLILPLSFLCAVAILHSAARAQDPVDNRFEPGHGQKSVNPGFTTTYQPGDAPAPGSAPFTAALATMPADVAALQARLEKLEQAERERALAAQQQDKDRQQAEEAAKKKKDQEDQAAQKKKAEEDKDKKDEWEDLSGEKWTVKHGGHVQMDYVNWANADAAIPDTKDYFEFRRLRLVADGAGYGVYDFRLQMTLEPETVGESPLGTVTSPDVKDAYFSINQVPGLGRLRMGNFFVPFSLEQVTNDTNNIFMERSIPSQGVFSPDREVGMAIYNCTEDQRVTWASGIFLDSISEGLKERLDDNQGYRASGRLTWLPYYDEATNGRHLLHTGMGILFTEDQDNRVRFRARPQIHEGPRLIDSGALLADKYTTGNVEAALVMGRVTFQTEAYLSVLDMQTVGNETVHGAYAHLSYFLTGENRVFEKFGQHGAQFGRNTPFTNVFATKDGSGLGAWELKARYSHLNLNSVQAGEYNDVTAGLNWYWSDRVRVMFDWIHPVTSGSSIFGQTHSDLLAMRFDFNW